MRPGRTAARIAMVATAIAVAAWLVLASSAIQGAVERLGSGPQPSRAPVAEARGAGEGAGEASQDGTDDDGAANDDARDGAADGDGEAGGDGQTGSARPGQPAGAAGRAGDGAAGEDAAERSADEASGDDGAGGRGATGARGGGEQDGSRDGGGALPNGADGGPGRADDVAGGDAQEDAAAIVDWPEVPEVAALEPLTTTAHFTVTVADAGDALLVATAETWAPDLEPLLAEAAERVGQALPRPPVAVVFARSYAARCPARGLASPGDDVPFLMVMVDEDTPDVQIRAVLAHELVHHLTYHGDFVGDAVLTEGVANWGAGEHALAWQGWSSWPEAARAYLEDGSYVSVADDTGQIPRDGEDCLARRDRVYNVRAAFVEWLVANYGRQTVLAMPSREVPDPASTEGGTLAVTDYAAATGHSLVALERRWLAELTGDASGPLP